MRDLPDAVFDRFFSYVCVLPNGCWLWLGGRSSGQGNLQPYGTFWVDEDTGSIRAHRFSSEFIAEDVCPPGHHRDHTCNFSLCVSPFHIEVVTHAENERRRQARRAPSQDGSEASAALCA